MASIYELTSEFQLIWNLMEEGNIEEETLKDTPEPVVNSEALKEVLQNGTEEQKKALEGIAHIEIGSHINIR